MHIRPFVDADLPALVELTVQTFRPFFEGYVAPLFGEELFRLHHGHWQQDYRDELPTLHSPAAGRRIAVAEIGGTIAGLIVWNTGERSAHGRIHLLAVSAPYRRQQVGKRLCVHAIEEMKKNGVEVVEIGTGEDAFHASARALYEDIGFIKVPIAGYIKHV